jgi:beta-galactosidase
VRLAHYQHAQHVYDLTDRHGLVVWAEIPLIDYIATSTAFRDNARQQLVELIRQNYNHPSILWWSISNEITLKTGPDATALQNDLGALAKAEDPTRPSTLASIGTASDIGHSTVIGFNKYYGWYYGVADDVGPWADQQHASTPALPFCLSEYGAGASVQMHADAPKMGDHTEEYQALYHEAHWRALKTRPFVWGKFVWNMFDFASSSRNEGDTPGRNDKGLVTYDRKTRKDAFYFYKASWTQTPFVYITGRRFAVRTQAKVDVKVYGTMESAELVVNGVSQGTRTPADGTYRWAGVTLAKGKNHVEVTGTRGAMTVKDAVDWTLN